METTKFAKQTLEKQAKIKLKTTKKTIKIKKQKKQNKTFKMISIKLQ